MEKPKFIITDNNITINFDGKTHTVPRAESLGEKLIEAIKAKDWEQIPNLLNVANKIEESTNGQFKVINGEVIFGDNFVAPDFLGRKIIQFMNEGLPHEPLVMFAQKLQQNPSPRSISELYGFLDKNNHPLTDNGNFIAYKRIRSNFKDIYTNTMDNSIGVTVKMDRELVDEDPNRTCSHGLHVANWEYAFVHFASSGRNDDILVEVEVNPKDVVAVPTDYSNAKMRVSEYKVLGIVKDQHPFNTALVNTFSEEEWSDEDEDIDDEYLSEMEDDNDCRYCYQSEDECDCEEEEEEEEEE